MFTFERLMQTLAGAACPAPTGLRHFYWHKRRFSSPMSANSALPHRTA